MIHPCLQLWSWGYSWCLLPCKHKMYGMIVCVCNFFIIYTGKILKLELGLGSMVYGTETRHTYRDGSHGGAIHPCIRGFLLRIHVSRWSLCTPHSNMKLFSLGPRLGSKRQHAFPSIGAGYPDCPPPSYEALPSPSHPRVDWG